ncbi:MAG TPA: hypothetical protein V6C81_29145 [Planktothrix sp.]|jgi:hypothetical protein
MKQTNFYYQSIDNQWVSPEVNKNGLQSKLEDCSCMLDESTLPEALIATLKSLAQQYISAEYTERELIREIHQIKAQVNEAQFNDRKEQLRLEEMGLGNRLCGRPAGERRYELARVIEEQTFKRSCYANVALRAHEMRLRVAYFRGQLSAKIAEVTTTDPATQLALAVLVALVKTCKTKSEDEILSSEFESVKGVSGSELRQAVVDVHDLYTNQNAGNSAFAGPENLEERPVVFLHPTKTQLRILRSVESFRLAVCEISSLSNKLERATAQLNYPQRSLRIRVAEADGKHEQAAVIRAETQAIEATLCFAGKRFERAVQALRHQREELEAILRRASAGIKNARSIEGLKELTTINAARWLVRNRSNRAETFYRRNKPISTLPQPELSTDYSAMGEAWAAVNQF